MTNIQKKPHGNKGRPRHPNCVNPPPSPLGNQYAKGSTTSGAPRTYDYEKEAQDLIEWSTRDDALRLYGFCGPKPYPFQALSEFSEKSVVFAEALVKVKNTLANRSEEYVSKGLIKDVVYNKTAHIYDAEYD